MDIEKIYKTAVAALTFIFLSVSASMPVMAETWTSLTSYAYAEKMITVDNEIYAVASGGLLVISSPDQQPEQYSNLDGLGTSVLTDITVAADNMIWLTGEGRLIRYDRQSFHSYLMVDNDDKLLSLFTIEDEGDELWIGSDHGLILFSKQIDGGQIQDSYELFGSLNPSPDVVDILLDGDSIWLATTAGLAVTDKTNRIAMKAPASWETYSIVSHGEMETDSISSLQIFENDIYVGTKSGLYRLDRNSDSLISVTGFSGYEIYDIKIFNSNLYIYAANGLWTLSGGTTTFHSTNGLSGSPRTGVEYSGSSWLASTDGGLFYLDGSSYIEYPYTGLPANNVSDVSISDTGLLTVLLKYHGSFDFIQNEWYGQPINVGTRVTEIVRDKNEDIWIASYGRGIFRVSDTVAQYNHLNSTLEESGLGNNYVAVTDVATCYNYIFASNYEPWGSNRISIGDLDHIDDPSYWVSLTSFDGITNDRIWSVDCFGSGIAIGSLESGLYFYDFGIDIVDKSDDRVVHFLSSQSTLISDIVNVVRFSPEGELWIGTAFGLSRFNSDFDIFDPLYGPFAFTDINLPAGLGPEITTIEFDSRGNTWVGTVNGLGKIDAINGEIQVFTSRNSGLLSDKIANISWDNLSGDIYISTDRGVSILHSNIGRPTNNIDSVFAFPNPYQISSSSDLLHFNFAGNATLSVYSIAGELIDEELEPLWDGRNMAGEKVASGVYLFVLTNSGGEIGRGKFLLVRNR